MKAQMKSGKIITGKLAETFSKIGIATMVNDTDKLKEPATEKRVVSEKSLKNLQPKNKKV
jgi:uncharacterized protein (UPF0371 family)